MCTKILAIVMHKCKEVNFQNKTILNQISSAMFEMCLSNPVLRPFCDENV